MAENQLPKGWVNTKCEDVSSIIRGITYSKNQVEAFPSASNVLVLRGGNIQDGKIDLSKKDTVYVNNSLVKQTQFLKKGDVVIVGSTGSKKLIGKPGVNTIERDNISFGAFLMTLRPSPIIESKYFDYYFLSDNYRLTIRELAGGVNINNIRKEYINSLIIPLPPLAEQQRIVAKLDKLFAHLEETKTRLNKIPQLLKNFRQSVLTQAVTGKIGENKNAYPYFKMEEVCSEFKYGSSNKSLNEGKVPVLRMGNLQRGKVDYSDLKYSVNDDEILKYALEKGDILFNRTNSPEWVGKTSLFDGKINSIYAGYIIKVKCTNKIKPEFLNYIMNSSYAKQWCMKVKSDGVSQSNINAQKLKSFEIPVPNIKEQELIVKKVNSLFSQSSSIEAKYKDLKLKMDNLPQSILAKAFKGELVAQLPTDGDAQELLDEIKKLKAQTANTKKKKK